jgi:hypothetical protein
MPFVELRLSPILGNWDARSSTGNLPCGTRTWYASTESLLPRSASSTCASALWSFETRVTSEGIHLLRAKGARTLALVWTGTTRVLRWLRPRGTPGMGASSLSKFVGKTRRRVTACRGCQRQVRVDRIGEDRVLCGLSVDCLAEGCSRAPARPRGHASAERRRRAVQRHVCRRKGRGVSIPALFSLLADPR